MPMKAKAKTYLRLQAPHHNKGKPTQCTWCLSAQRMLMNEKLEHEKDHIGEGAAGELPWSWGW
jgi:hypothetical protein